MTDLVAEAPAPRPLKAGDIRAALRRYFAPPDCAIVFEVAQSTGAGAHRHLDAVAMELWPSRGLALHGIEIKCNFHDWIREKRNPEKAEQVARFCDLFWVAAPAGLVPIADLPMAWGLLEVGQDGTTKASKAALPTDATPVGRPFLAAMLRAAGRSLCADEMDSMLETRMRELEAGFEARVKVQAEYLSGVRNDNRDNWRKLVEALGHDPSRFWEQENLIAAIKAVMTAGVAATYLGLPGIDKELADVEKIIGEQRKRLREAMAPLGIVPAEQPKRKRVAL